MPKLSRSYPPGWLLLGLAVLTVASAPAAARDAPADPAAVAVERCGSRNTAEERRCYETLLLARLREEGAGAALALLDRLAALDADVRREGHMYAHGIGIAALTAPEEVGRIFATCTPAFQSGCYHGVIQSYFLARQRGAGDPTAEAVDALCGDYRGPPGDPWLLFQCTHGLGHGLAILNGHHLPRALAACDLLSRPGERENCYGGAFMETIVNATHPHHAAADQAGHGSHGSGGATAHAGHGDGGHGAHAGHGDGGHAGHADAGGHAHGEAGAAPFRALDPDDLHYPCSAVEEKHLEACYTMQTSAMLHLTGHDVRRTAQECGRAPERVRRTCFVSLGRDVSGIAVGAPLEARRLCDLAEPADRPACHVGVVQAYVNMDADPGPGLAYCRILGAGESKRACYQAVGEQAGLLSGGGERRDQACAEVEEGYRAACLGAPAES